MDAVRALRIIEGMALSVFEFDAEDKLAGDLYQIAHQAGKPDCAKHHPDFETRALEIEQKLVDAGIINAWGSEPTKIDFSDI